MIQNILSILNFKFSNDEGEVVTLGSIVLGALLRLLIIIGLVSFITGNYYFNHYQLFSLVLIWFFVAWPVYTNYAEYSRRSKEFVDNTLCGSCSYFEKSAQLCKIYDEHPTNDYIPCDGDNWEPKDLEI